MIRRGRLAIAAAALALAVPPARAEEGAPAGAGERSPTVAIAPAPSASGPDVELTVPGASVKRVALDVERLEARLDLDTAVADLVHVRAGVVATVENLRLELEEVQTSAQLLVRLERVTDVLGKALDAVDRRSDPATPRPAAASVSLPVPTPAAPSQE